MDGMHDEVGRMLIFVGVPVVAGVQELAQVGGPSHLVWMSLMAFMKPLVGPPGCVSGCCCASRNLAWSCSQKAALPFFQVPPVFGVAKGLMVTLRLLPRPWAAHGCSCSKYCSVTESQFAHCCAAVLTGMSYRLSSKACVLKVDHGLKSMSGTAGRAGKYCTCRNSLVAASMSRWSVRRA